ncbi:acyl-CoA carboxylase subunit epsilon [Tessaracoccus antarcticus]|uniref:Acyl-CoA carboxylase subunit epsilon n=1 Tax=Tessaracoccus antarcticus TaxID=2479848 RepID=A0A3M0GY03_9ACTN|nr:acyl-CoA carboxylase subunit epsilon [Tessaracoccus antarcticus]RMB62266.1 acyl-CoA carboxylase subunit epsilon [Tessaracoccus antarcticus]
MTADEPLYAVSRTQATDEELAAVFAVLQARASTDTLKAGTDRPLAGGWKSYYRTVRQSTSPGREAWRTSIRF